MPQQVLFASTVTDVTGVHDTRARVFVGLTWLVMVAGAVTFVLTTARNLPLGQDWSVVASIAGPVRQPLDWIFSADGGAVGAPLSRFGYYLALMLSGGDFRVPALASLACLGLVAGGMLRVVRRVRGRASYLDVIFPVVLLNLGHAQSLVWAWQFTEVIPVLASTAMVMMLIGGPSLSKPVSGTLAAIGLLLLVGSGGPGPVMGLVWATGFLFVSSRRLRQGRAGRGVLWPSVLLAVTSAATIAMGVVRVATTPRGLVADPFRRILHLAATAVGPAGGMVDWTAGLAVIVVIGAALAVALRAARDASMDARRYRAVALYLVALVVALVAAGFGFVRLDDAGYAPDHLSSFVEFSAPLWCVAYLALGGLRQTRPGTPGAVALSAVALLVLPFNVREGLRWGSWYRDGMDTVERGILLRSSTSALAVGQRDFLARDWAPEDLAERMEWLRARSGVWSRLAGSIVEQPVVMAQWEDLRLEARQFRFKSARAGAVSLVWGVDGWKVAPTGQRPTGTVVINRSMHTPMTRTGDDFSVSIDVPLQTAVQYGFLIEADRNGAAVPPVWVGDFENGSTAPTEVAVQSTPAIEAEIEPGPQVEQLALEIRYWAPDADSAEVWWEVGRSLPASVVPPGTTPEGSGYLTAMRRERSTFLAELRVPARSQVRYRFRYSISGSNRPLMIDSSEAFQVQPVEPRMMVAVQARAATPERWWRWLVAALVLAGALAGMRTAVEPGEPPAVAWL